MKRKKSLLIAKKQQSFKTGDEVRIEKIPPDLKDSAGIDTRAVFQRALGKKFCVIGIDTYGHLELEVSRRDTIWIESEFVTLAKKVRRKQ